MSLIPFTVGKLSVILVNDETCILLIKAFGINLPMLINPYEALCISQITNGCAVDKRLPSVLFEKLIKTFNAPLTKIVISEICDDEFVTTIFLEKDGEEIAFPAFPSDAIALALSLNAPMFIEEQVVIEGSEEESTQGLIDFIEEVAPQYLTD